MSAGDVRGLQTLPTLNEATGRPGLKHQIKPNDDDAMCGIYLRPDIR
jgi:hypothetical protein